MKSEIQSHKSKIEMADKAGFEPVTSALTVRHSTTELLAMKIGWTNRI